MFFDVAHVDGKGKVRVVDTRVPRAVLKITVARHTAHGRVVQVSHSDDS